MYEPSTDELLFFDGHRAALSIYEVLAECLFARYPDAKMKVQKTQITFSNRHVFACVSFLRVRKKAELPDAWLVVTLGLNYPLESERVAAKTEPYPGRWTTHILLASPKEVDGELLDWVDQAYDFAEMK